MLGGDEALRDRVVEEGDEARPVAAHVEQAERLGVQAELGPGVDLEQLVERAGPARQRDEAVREVGHQRLALVHRVHDVQLAQPRVRDLAVDERLRDHADDLAARGERRVGDRAHQADARAAVDEADARAGERAAERRGRLRVVRVGAGARPGEDAEPSHGGRAILRWRAHGPRDLQGVRRARACTASRSTATSPSRWGARSPGCSAACAGKPTSDLRVGLGRDMRLTAPELAAAIATGSWRRACTSWTRGWWGRRCSTSSSARASWTAG